MKCKDCGQDFSRLLYQKWCEDCFEKGVSKDMAEHFEQTIKDEIGKLINTGSEPAGEK